MFPFPGPEVLPDLGWRAGHTTEQGFLLSQVSHTGSWTPGVLLQLPPLWMWPTAGSLVSLPTSKRMGWTFKDICIFDNTDPTREQDELSSHCGTSAHCCGRNVLGQLGLMARMPSHAEHGPSRWRNCRVSSACVPLSSTAVSSCPLACAFLYMPLPKR